MDESYAQRLVPPVSDRDHEEGPLNAPITLVEFGDYQCPYCAAMNGVVEALLTRMKDRLRYVFRHFPLQMHEFAARAAEAAECAGAQGEFWAMHNALFNNQQALDLESLCRYAQQISLDVDRFRADLTSHRYIDQVRFDVQSGFASGVEGTPTLFINGYPYIGSTDFNSLLAALQQSRAA